MTLIWTKEALERLNEIEEFIGSNNPERAETFVNYLIKSCEPILDNPNIGRVVPDFSNTDIREIIVKKYRIVYRVNNKTIEILTVFEGHRLFKIDELEIAK